LLLRFSDFPTFVTRVRTSRALMQPEYTEHYGYLVPYFYVFAYQEKTRYRQGVAAGLLAARTNDPLTFLPAPGIEPTNFVSDSSYIDFSYTPSGEPREYYNFTAASMFGQQRVNHEHGPTHVGSGLSGLMSECFISHAVPPGKTVTLYIQQAEDHERCIGGLRLLVPFATEERLSEDLESLSERLRALFPDSLDFTLLEGLSRVQLEAALRNNFLRIPGNVDFCERVGIRVFELDPLDGVSPLLVPLDGEHATLLADRQIDELSEILQALLIDGIRFLRPSSSRYFALELTNRDTKPGQFVIKLLELIQSAHVSVHPRASRTRQIRALHFRLIGTNLV